MLLALSKLLTWLASPLVMALALGVAAWREALRGRRRRSWLWLGLGAAWLLVWTSPLFYAWFGSTLERQYPPLRAEETPAGDAIVVLGGGMEDSCILPYPDMTAAADRVWHAARLFHAGKAPLVIVSGLGDDHAAVPLLADLGVPAGAIRAEAASRNTAENARGTAALLARAGAGRRIVLVTSAWHMRRARLLFERAGLAVIPAATDHEATLARARVDRWSLPNLLPSPDALQRNTAMLKEYIGYWVYRVCGGRAAANVPAAAATPGAGSHAGVP